MTTDVRWRQRFANFKRALAQLDSAVSILRERGLSDLERQGLVQAFEFTYELSWNVLKDYLLWQGIGGITGSRDTIREAFAQGLIKDGDAWMNMLVDRNKTAHTYNESTATEIIDNVDRIYFDCFKALEQQFHALEQKHD